MKKLLFISLIESIYLMYMFHYFETTVDFNVLSSPNGWWFEHIIGGEKGLRICPFGRVTIFGLIFVLIARNYGYVPKNFVHISLMIAAVLSLMNLNAVVYLMPVWIIELCLHFNI